VKKNEISRGLNVSPALNIVNNWAGFHAGSTGIWLTGTPACQPHYSPIEPASLLLASSALRVAVAVEAISVCKEVVGDSKVEILFCLEPSRFSNS